MRSALLTLLACLLWCGPIFAGPPGAPVLGGLTSPDGTVEITCNLPLSEMPRNIGGNDNPDGSNPRNEPGKGSGLCVYTSVMYCARWQSERTLTNLQAWASRRPGGSYPDKLARDLALVAPDLKWIQDTSGDLDLLKLAIRTGRGVGVTYAGHDPFYGSQTIAHMVFLCHLDDRWAAIIDNNHPQDVVWMSPAEFERRWLGKEFRIRGGGSVGGGWAVCLLRAAPTPYPRNGRSTSGGTPATCAANNGGSVVMSSTGMGGLTGLLTLFSVLQCPGGICQPAYQPQYQPPVYWHPPVVAQPAPVWHTPPVVVQPAPVPAPEPAAAPEEPKNFGLDLNKMKPGRAWNSGRECDRAEVFAALQKVPASDEGRPFITVIGTQAERERVLADLDASPALAEFKGKYRVKDYSPADWQVKGGFVTKGTPTIYVQTAGGTVLHRRDDYAGPEQLAVALRRADPNYDPARDPDLTRPVAPKVPDPKLPDPRQPDPKTPEPARPFSLNDIPFGGWLLAAVALAAFFLNRKVA